MKKILSLTLLLFSQASFAQINLAPNFSFEQYDTCPDNFNQVNRCTFWRNVSPNNFTPDYFNACSSNPNISPPSVSWGYQNPHSGNAYCLTACYSTLGLGREYIQVILTQPLITGIKYFASLYANLGGQAGVSLATNKLGILFTTYPFSTGNPAYPINFAHIYTDSILTDTVNWYHLKGLFIADSAYQYLTIGNFFDDQHTDTISLMGVISQASGYFIDDVCVSTDSLLCFITTGIGTVENNNTTMIFPNPCSDFITIESNHLLKNIAVFDYTGKLIEDFKNVSTDKLMINCKNWKGGLYMIKTNEGFYKQLIIH